MIGNDRLGPVAEATTRERCIVLYPGSNPGRASSLRLLRKLRLGKPRRSEGCRDVARRAKSGVGQPFPPHRTAAQNSPICRLMARFWGFRGCGIWSKDHPRARVTRALGLGDAQHARPFFVPKIQSARPDAQKNRHLHHPDHRRRPHRDRPGLRIRLFRHPGGEGAEGRGLPGRPGQFQSGDDHDRPGTGRCHLYRADHAGNRRQDHRKRTPRHSRRLCAAADHGRPDRAELRAVAPPSGHTRQVRRRNDRRHR